MILMRASPLQGPLEGVGPENRNFFRPRNGNERYFQGPPLPMARVMDLPPSKLLSLSSIYNVLCTIYQLLHV
jgi:hypothetical protein